MPFFGTGISRPHLNLGLHGTVAEVDHDQISLVIVGPTPSDKILKTLVIGPASSPAQAPLTFAEGFAIDSFQERCVEPVQILVHRLIRTPAQKYGWPYLATFKLPFME